MPGELLAERAAFRVRVDTDGGRFWLDTDSLTQEFRADIGIDSVTAFDRTVTVAWLGSEHREAFERFSWSAVSPSGASGFFPDSAASRATFTHLLSVISWTPMFRATSATGRPPSMTKATDCSLYSGVNARRVEPISRSPDEPGS
jgi:hypothetical protein